MMTLRRIGRLGAAFGFLAMALLAAAQRTERPALNITGYVIDAELDTQTHHIAAKAVVTFNAPENAEMVSFGFHPALKVTKITDDAGKLLTGERSADGAIRVAPSTAFAKGQTYHWTFDYEGVITGNEDGPVEGLRLAAIQEPITYLLYAARWFPTTGYMTDRFTAEMHIKVPQGLRVFASGSTWGVASGQAGRRKARRPVRLQLDQAGLPRHGDRRPLRESRGGGSGQREGVPDGGAPGRRRRPGADRHQAV